MLYAISDLAWFELSKKLKAINAVCIKIVGGLGLQASVMQHRTL